MYIRKMKLLSYSHPSTDHTPRFGAIGQAADAATIIDLTSRMTGVRDLSDLLAQGRLDEARSIVATADLDGGADVKETDVTFLRTLPSPGKIFCIGVNYGGRNAEYRPDEGAGQDAPTKPSVFVRFPSSFTGHGHDLVRPPESPQLDYEGEIVAVIGTGGRRIPRSQARQHIAGLALGNEGTIRDWVRHAKFNVTQGKNFDGSGAIGPWLVPFKDDSQLLDIKLETRVNGEVRQSDRSSRMIFNHAAEIAYISTFTTLVPGDMIVTGTPTGAGARFDPPVYLKPGDVVEVEVEGVGVLRNGVVDEV